MPSSTGILLLEVYDLRPPTRPSKSFTQAFVSSLLTFYNHHHLQDDLTTFQVLLICGCKRLIFQFIYRNCNYTGKC